MRGLRDRCGDGAREMNDCWQTKHVVLSEEQKLGTGYGACCALGVKTSESSLKHQGRAVSPWGCQSARPSERSGVGTGRVRP